MQFNHKAGGGYAALDLCESHCRNYTREKAAPVIAIELAPSLELPQNESRAPI